MQMVTSGTMLRVPSVLINRFVASYLADNLQDHLVQTMMALNIRP